LKRYILFLVFIVSLALGVIIHFVSSGNFADMIRPVAHAPVLMPEIDYSISTAITGDTVNINTASLAELDTLSGIGQSYAKRIIKYRTIMGGFEVPEDIMKVPGIGEKRFLKIKDKISVE